MKPDLSIPTHCLHYRVVFRSNENALPLALASPSSISWSSQRRRALKEKPEWIARILRPEDEEQQTESSQEDGGPHIHACPLPRWIPLSRHQHGQCDEAECQQGVDGRDDLRLHTILILESACKVLWFTPCLHCDVRCATDRVPHVARVEDDHASDAEQHPDRFR